MAKTEQEIIDFVKEICDISNLILLEDIMAKISLCIYLNTNSTRTKIEFETTPTKDNKIFIGEFKYKELRNKNAKNTRNFM